MAKITVNFTDVIDTINPNLYGHFVEHLGGVVYDGIWVGEESKVENIHGFRKELVEKLKALHPSVIRWPGGCFAETYDWRDGIGPREQRPVTVNWWYNDDGLYESNQVGTHEMVDFCELVGADPYFALNATSKTPLEGRNWIEYCVMEEDSTTLAKLRKENGHAKPFNIPYWGLGNENWGGGGCMTPEDYCEKYRTYGILAYSVNPQGKYVACGANESIPDWTDRFFEKYKQMFTANRRPTLYGYSLHYYVANFGELGNELEYSHDQWYETLKRTRDIEGFLNQQISCIDAKMPGNDIAIIVDEWGLWHRAEGHLERQSLFEQDSTIRDAIVAGITLNIFNNHCDRVKMANVAQLVNCIQSLFLAHDDKLVLTSTYHVFDMFQAHQNAAALATSVQTDTIPFAFAGTDKAVEKIFASASVKDGQLCMTLVNTSMDDDEEVEFQMLGGCVDSNICVTTLQAEDLHKGNTFEEPDYILPVETETTWDPEKPVIKVPKASILKVCVGCKI